MTNPDYAQCGARATRKRTLRQPSRTQQGELSPKSASASNALALASDNQQASPDSLSAQKRGDALRNGSATACPVRSDRARKVAARSAAPVAKNPADRRKKMGVRNKQIGCEGENLAANFLVNRGYEIIARNWSCAAGEADIIARDADTLVFVEVKTRTSIEKGLPSDAVDQRKRGKYERIATYFTQRFEADSIPIRFDVISVLMKEDRATLRHHINAFGVA